APRDRQGTPLPDGPLAALQWRQVLLCRPAQDAGGRRAGTALAGVPRVLAQAGQRERVRDRRTAGPLRTARPLRDSRRPVPAVGAGRVQRDRRAVAERLLVRDDRHRLSLSISRRRWLAPTSSGATSG